MQLQSLKITQFKNIESAELAFSPRLNCFVGLNGMGKTNCLDAIYYLCLCKSHRGLPDRNLVLHDRDFFRLEAAFDQNSDRSTVLARYANGGRKHYERNGVGVDRLTDYIGSYPVVMIAPDDVALVQEGSEERRRFLDTTLSQISVAYLGQLLAYNNLLKQRNALLKRFAEERRFDLDLLQVYDRQMDEPAALLYRERQAMIGRFAPLLSGLYQAIAGGHERASVAYLSDAAEAPFSERMAGQLERDRILQRTTLGPHRDDLEMLLDDQSVRKFASQGQIKSYLLAMRLAQYELLRQEKSQKPLLLLDDIFDKLDTERVRQLIGLIIERDFGQIFITDAQRARMEAVLAAFPGDYRLFEVSEGVVTS